MNPTPNDLLAEWRSRADLIRQYGDPNTARLWEIAAAELERALRQVGDEPLSLVAASRLCEYTPDHLGSLVRRGVIPNAGRPNAPRIRRADLPHKRPDGPGRPSRVRATPDREQLRHAALTITKEKRK
jgi:hypothetical protein